MAYILHPLWKTDLGEISVELQEGWANYLRKICTNLVQQNSLEDDLLKFLHK